MAVPQKDTESPRDPAACPQGRKAGTRTDVCPAMLTPAWFTAAEGWKPATHEADPRWRINKVWSVHTAELFSLKKEGNLTPCHHVDGP